jgi:glycine cleavage system H lipoate-binding protein/NAD-dependent dihydropyrimidine dehydrogenase PreA subunit
MITLTINGKKVKAKEDTTLLELCRKISISIPTLCYHPDLAPHGSCRLCTVEVLENGTSRMVTACNYPARSGIKVETHSGKVLQARRILVELLLARCPNVPFVKDLARELGVEKTPFKSENSENNCILCGLCVRTCSEIVGAQAIGFSKRGTLKKVGTPFEVDSDKCIACGACEFICPTGAIHMEMDRIKKIKLTDTGTRRYCRYMRLGLIDFMICSNGFECWRCEVDQAMEDRFGTHPAFAVKPASHKQPFPVNGFTFFPAFFYSQGHVWAEPSDQVVRLGLDDMASAFAMEADSIQLPPAGRFLKKGQILAEMVCAGKKAQVLSPIEGTVVAVNHDVEESPSLAWRDPYRRGWLLMIEPVHPEDLSQLYSGEPAKTWFTEQAINLAALFMKWAPKTSKKGAPQDGQVIRMIVREHWAQLTEVLLKNSDKLEAPACA